jgi:hypothetical protein
MLYINQNTATLVVTQCQELATSSHYLWRLYHTQLHIELLFYPTIQTENDRYTSFELTINNALGEWDYTIYQGNGTDTDYISMPILEEGILKILENEQS